MGENNRPLPAYNNLEFINSPDARLIRVMCEFIEPLRRFRKMAVRDTIVFFTAIAGFLLFTDLPLLMLAQALFRSMDNFALVVVLFFILCGNIMTTGSIVERLIRFANMLVSWLPGGLGMAGVTACALFGAISGSTVATKSASSATDERDRCVHDGRPRHCSYSEVGAGEAACGAAGGDARRAGRSARWAARAALRSSGEITPSRLESIASNR